MIEGDDDIDLLRPAGGNGLPRGEFLFDHRGKLRRECGELLRVDRGELRGVGDGAGLAVARPKKTALVHRAGDDRGDDDAGDPAQRAIS